MRPEAVRYHLSVLVEDGRVVASGAQQTGIRGRPKKLYRLSESERGQNLTGLALAMLGWLERRPSGRKRAVYDEIAGELAGQLSLQTAGNSGAKRLAGLIGGLNARHYAAKWEAGAEGPRVLFAHCPYAAIIDKHPELCGIDARVLTMALGAKAIQTAKIGSGPAGPSHCIFELR